MKKWFIATSLLFTLCVALPGQAPKSVGLSLKETAGMRRFAFPVSTRVPFAKGSLASAANVRLLLNQADIPVESTVESLWPDGSVQWLAVDFYATIGPRETQAYRLEYGPEVKSAPEPRPLTLTEDAASIQVGGWRFSKTGKPLVLSVKYRNEEIGAGLNGIAVTDAAGAVHDLSGAEPPKVEIIKRGPLDVQFRYSGRIPIDTQYSVSYTITVEMPNRKAWAKISTSVEDPAKRLRELAFQTPVALGPLPWVWDFGTERWTYGALQTAQDSVTLTQTVRPQGVADWEVSNGPKGKEQLYEKADRSAPIGWAHLQNRNEAVALVMEDVARQPGTYRVTLDGDGQTSFRFAAAQPATSHHLAVYEHFIRTPVHIGAATSPASVLNPLVAEWERAQYTASGMKPPRSSR